VAVIVIAVPLLALPPLLPTAATATDNNNDNKDKWFSGRELKKEP